MTMRELAKLCNVSVSTVSKAFCEADDVSNETKELIFKTAKEQGCFGKYYKGKYQKKIIAVICPELVSEYYTIFIEELGKLIEANDGISVISYYNFDMGKKCELIEYFASYLKVDGIIVIGTVNELKKGYDVPIVSILSSSNNFADSVGTDTEWAMREAINTLIDYGHKKIAYIGEPLTVTKAAIFEAIIKETDSLSYTVIQSEHRFEEAGINGVKQLLKENGDYTAIICAYDRIAFGAIKELKNNRLKVPEDISVIGIDNITLSQFAETSLTTIDTNPSDICSIAWDLLRKKLKNKYYRINQSITVKPRLIIRESIGKAKKD